MKKLIKLSALEKRYGVDRSSDVARLLKLQEEIEKISFSLTEVNDESRGELQIERNKLKLRYCLKKWLHKMLHKM
jgi:hypothetical protein